MPLIDLSFLEIVGVMWTLMTILFVVSLLIKRNDIADVAWGTGILLVGLLGYLTHSGYDSVGSMSVATLLLVLYALWGVRLTYRIGKRNLKKREEDYRYKKWRDTWKFFYVRSYFQVYLLQGALMLVVGSPLLIVGLYDLGVTAVSEILVYVGLSVWIIGFFFEVIGDYQLDEFIKNPKNKGRVLQSGLWKYSRHPNYFGEVTMWWGIWLTVASLPMSILALISPVAITFLILKVSGIPMLEKKFAGNPEFETYKKRTSVFFPLPPKRAS